jgi:YidC/Oxa1 family membrane protein insertase
MGWILQQLYEFLDSFGMGNYAVAILLFTVLVNVVFLPLSVKQQKSTAKQASLRPKLEALKEKCGDDQRRYQTEMQALYQKENVSMMGGCWTLLVRLPFLWGVWQAIRSPLSYILGVSEEVVKKATDVLLTLNTSLDAKTITELDIVENINSLVAKDASFSELAAKIQTLDFNFFGINLTETPQFKLDFSTVGWIWVIPFIAFATSMLSSVVSLQMQKKTNPQAAQNSQMGCMMLSMPLMSLWIAFTVPGAVGFYWICSNLVNMVVQMFTNKVYGPYTMIARDEAKIISERRAKELELKAKQ